MVGYLLRAILPVQMILGERKVHVAQKARIWTQLRIPAWSVTSVIRYGGTIRICCHILVSIWYLG